MTEMRDAVTFMCIFLDFKTVEPATTAAGGIYFSEPLKGVIFSLVHVGG